MWPKLKQQIWEWRGVAIAAPSVAGFVIALRFAGLLQLLELAAIDQFFRLRPVEAIDPRIVIVGIDESDLHKTGKWPIPDRILAELLEKIKKQKPTAIGLDIYRDLPVEPGHKALVNVFGSTPNLIGIKTVVGDTKSYAIAPPPELERRDQVAANDLVSDNDGKIRRALLSLRTKNGEEVFTLGTKLALMYLERHDISLKPIDESKNEYQLGQGVFVPWKHNDGGYIRADTGGYQLLLNFRGAAGSFQTVSLREVLENRIPPNLMRDRIVLIGSTAESLRDLFLTPYNSSTLFKALARTSGVEIHANVISQILSAALDGRSLFKSWSEPTEWLWIFGASALGATLSWKWRYSGGVKRRSLAGILLAAAIYGGGAYAAFLWGWWIPVVPPLVALALSAIAITSYIARTAADIRETFGRYLTDEVVASLLETPEGLKFGGERRNITILMSDLRGFSAISERLPPEKVVEILNIYLSQMAEIISKYQGTIDEFIGDAILVLFGAPTQREDDAERAVACAIAMQMTMESINEHLKQLGLPKIEMGIGINTGEVVVGNIGSLKRAKYGVVGSNVNLTSRIESYTVGGQILISESTLKAVESVLQIDGEKLVEPKGVKEAIAIYDVGGISGNYNLFLSTPEDTVLPLKEQILLHYTVIDGKHLVGTTYPGSLVELSAKGAMMRSEHVLPPLSNIKINLLTGSDGAEFSGDLYAKVVEQLPDSDSSFSIRFTAIPPDVAEFLQDMYEGSSDLSSASN